MTVKDLIEELSKYPKDMSVYCGTDHCESTDIVEAVILEKFLDRERLLIFGGY